MQEVLSKSREDAKLPDGEQFIELCLSDIGPDDKYPSFWVTETLYQWDAVKKQITKGNPQIYSFETLDEARNWYHERRRVLSQQGFKDSDLDW